MPSTTGPVLPRPGKALFHKATWRELVFHLAQLPVVALGLVWFIGAVTIGGIAAATIVGLPLTAWFLDRSRWITDPTRRLSMRLLNRRVPVPEPPTQPVDISVRLRDPAAWRRFAYLAVGAAVAIISATTTLTVLLTGLAALFMPVWGQHPLPIELLTAGAGLVLVLVWPWINHTLIRVQSAAIDGMLGETQTERRLAAALSSRDTTLRGADETLRRIERELHDGTQARLVSLAITLGDTLDRLHHGNNTDEIQPQIATALATTKEALTELRALVQGIHPPVLDAGLEPALTSAAARTPLPVKVQVHLPERPPAAVESIVYFGVLELLTNVHKHAGATGATVTVTVTRDQLVATVQDDGRGGAVIAEHPSGGAGGTGLAGLRDRVGAVDGTLHLESPTGGPTAARITIPWRQDP